MSDISIFLWYEYCKLEYLSVWKFSRETGLVTNKHIVNINFISMLKNVDEIKMPDRKYLITCEVHWVFCMRVSVPKNSKKIQDLTQ